MPRTAPKASSQRPPRRRTSRRLLKLTAVYTPCPEGYAAEILEADTVVSQGATLDEARENLAEALGLMLDEAPHQVGKRPKGHEPPPYTLMEPLFVLVDRAR